MTFGTRKKLANISLFILTISFLILLGGGNYEAINVSRVIASAPPKSLAILQGPYKFFPVPFWVLFHPISELFFILALGFNWKASLYRRKLLLYAIGGALVLQVVTL